MGVYWSSNSAYMTSACADGNVLLWSVSESEPVKVWKNSCHVSGFDWHPSLNSIVYADCNGNLGMVEGWVPDSFNGRTLIGPHEKSDKEWSERIGVALASQLFDDEAQVDSWKDEDKPSIGRPTKFLPGESLSEDDEVDYGPEGYDSEMLADAAFVENDDGDIYAGQGHLMAPKAVHQARRQQQECPCLRIQCQKEIQAGSTPLQNSKRYLAFTTLGTVYTLHQATHATIHVEFHDKALKSFHITDTHMY